MMFPRAIFKGLKFSPTEIGLGIFVNALGEIPLATGGNQGSAGVSGGSFNSVYEHFPFSSRRMADHSAHT